MAKQRKSEINKDSLKNDIVISDINKSMLEVGKQRAKNKGIHEGLFCIFVILTVRGPPKHANCLKIHNT